MEGLKPSDLDKYGRWIPGEIYYNSLMTLLDKILFGLIYFHCEKEGGTCTAKDADLARDLNVKTNTIKKSLNKLEGEGYIMRDKIKNASGLVTKRAIRIDDNFKALYPRRNQIQEPPVFPHKKRV